MTFRKSKGIARLLPTCWGTCARGSPIRAVPTEIVLIGSD